MIWGGHDYFEAQDLFHGWIPRLMGTRLEMVLAGLSRTDSLVLWDSVCRESASLEKVFDRFDAGAEVARVNAAVKAGEEGIPVSETLAEAVEEASGYWKETLCLFDITRGAGSGLRLENCGPGAGSGRLLYTRGADLDFGGFAKGYLLRRIKRILQEGGVRDAFVDFGSSAILALGNHPYGEGWSVDVRDPFSASGTLGSFAIKDASLSTSGNMPGHTGHIINPLTGLQCHDRKVVAVVSPDPLEAEVLSTTLMLASPDETDILESRFQDARKQVFRL